MRTRIVIIGILIAMTGAITVGQQSGNDLYQQGLARETAGDIKGAVQIFERIVRDYSSNRALTARALLQLGRWSDLLGQNQARSYYERVVREFADQPDLTDVVAQAKTRLAAIPGATQTASSAAMTVQQLPDVTKTGELMAVSPDGTSAIVMDYSKGQNLAIYDFSKKQTRLLTNLDWSMGWTYRAIWSPDGRRVAYQFGKDRLFELRVTTLDGKSNTVYRTDVDPLPYLHPVAWTPDSATLVVLAVRPDGTWVLGTLPAAGGAFTLVRSLGWSYDSQNATPRLSSDGRFISYLEGERGLRDVYVVSIDGRNVYRITDHPADDMAPVWSPDSRHLAFTSNRLGSVSVWTVEIRDGKPVGQPAKLRDGMLSATRLIDWTDRGIFCEQETSAWDLYTVSMDPVQSRPTGSPQQLRYPRTGRNVSPAWSPNGEQFAFVSSTAAEPNLRYVVVMPADGGPAREFAIPTANWQYPASPPDLRWFGNGRGLGFSGFDTRGTPAVFRLTLETGQWDTIPQAHVDGWQLRTEWNFDGTAFYVALKSPNAGIFEHTVKDDTERLIYRASTGLRNLLYLEFSPDRKWLAFRELTAEANNKGISRLLLLDVEKGETRKVLEEFLDLNDPSASAPAILGWTPSGDLIIRRRGAAGVREVSMLPVNGGTPRPVALPTFPPGSAGEAQPDLTAKWSPNGRSMLLERSSRGWDTFVIENPLAGLRAATAAR
jgi:Tol biopolymer transport system component